MHEMCTVAIDVPVASASVSLSAARGFVGQIHKGGFRHVQHVRPNRGPHKKGHTKGQKNFFHFFAT